MTWRAVCFEMYGLIRLRAPIAEDILLLRTLIWLDHERCSSIITPSDLASLTLVIYLASISTFTWLSENEFKRWFDPITINSVFATFKLSLLEMSHILRLLTSEFKPFSRSVNVLAKGKRPKTLISLFSFYFTGTKRTICWNGHLVCRWICIRVCFTPYCCYYLWVSLCFCHRNPANPWDPIP